MLIKTSTYHLSFSRTAFWRVGVWEISTKTSSRYELGNQNGGASPEKHYFCTGGEASLFSSCCTTSCIVCRSSSSRRRFCSACLWLLLFLLFRRLHRLLLFLSVCLLQEMAAHSPLLWEDQRKISQLKSDFSIIDISI